MCPTNAFGGDNSGLHRICVPLSASCFYTASSEEEKAVSYTHLTEEGYINLTGTQQYHYYLKDHQGNNRVVTVSYTHLDVYKRQSLNSPSIDAIARTIGEAAFGFGAGKFGGMLLGKAIGSVSYTHLDVYKRQLML